MIPCQDVNWSKLNAHNVAISNIVLDLSLKRLKSIPHTSFSISGNTLTDIKGVASCVHLQVNLLSIYVMCYQLSISIDNNHSHML